MRDAPLLTKLGDELRRESNGSGELFFGKSEFCCGIIKRHASTFPLCLTPFASVGRIFNETTWLSYFSSNAVWLNAWRVVNVWRLTPRAFFYVLGQHFITLHFSAATYISQHLVPPSIECLLGCIRARKTPPRLSAARRGLIPRSARLGW